MYLKRFSLFFILFLAISCNQSCSLLASFPQSKQEQVVDTLAINQTHQLYRKQVIVQVTSIVLHFLNIFFFWKKMYITILLDNLLLTSFLFSSLFSYHQHLNSLLARTKIPKVYSVFELVLLIFSIAPSLIATTTLFNESIHKKVFGFVVFPCLLIYIVLHTIKQYHYEYPQQADKSFLSSMKRCIISGWLDWLLFTVSIISVFIIQKSTILLILLIALLPQIYTLRESQLLLSDRPFWANLCSIIEFTIGLVVACSFIVSRDAANKGITCASIWIIFKNLVLILLPLIQKYRKKINYDVDG